MTPSQLSEAVLRSVRGAVDGGELGEAVRVPERVVVRPAPGAGEWGTGVAFGLARQAGMPAERVASIIGRRLAGLPGIGGVSVGGGGFLNVRLGNRSDAELVAEILRRPRAAALPEDTAHDVARWAAATGRSAEDPALLVQREPRNPLFLVRYAQARTRALARAAAALGVSPEPGEYPFRSERVLLALLGERAPGDGPPGWLVAVADAFLETERERPALPLGEEKPQAAHRARLALAQAAGTVLAGGLTELGISAPELI